MQSRNGELLSLSDIRDFVWGVVSIPTTRHASDKRWYCRLPLLTFKCDRTTPDLTEQSEDGVAMSNISKSRRKSSRNIWAMHSLALEDNRRSQGSQEPPTACHVDISTGGIHGDQSESGKQFLLPFAGADYSRQPFDCWCLGAGKSDPRPECCSLHV